jgi:hypothetical protein
MFVGVIGRERERWRRGAEAEVSRAVAFGRCRRSARAAGAAGGGRGGTRCEVVRGSEGGAGVAMLSLCARAQPRVFGGPGR